MLKGLRKQYETLRKKHKLPTFDELDLEFRISQIEADGFLLESIREKMAERISHVRGVVEEVLQPDTNLADLYESRVFSEEEKKRLFELYKKLMVADRRALELSILNDEQQDASFIKSFYEEWKRLKPQLAKFIRQLRESGEKDTEEREAVGYMG